MWNDGLERMHQNGANARRGHSFDMAVQWWKERLAYYEMTTKEGVIMYPRDICWTDVYNNEFVPEMQLIGIAWRVADAPPLQGAESGEVNSGIEDAAVDEGEHYSNYDGASSDASTYGSRPTWYRAKTAALAQVPSAPNMRAAAHTRTTEM